MSDALHLWWFGARIYFAPVLLMLAIGGIAVLVVRRLVR